MNRRTFASRIGSFALLAFAAGSSAVMVGCSVFTNILNWIPVGVSAVDSIVALLGPLVPPGAVAIIALVKAAFADLAAAITQYNADTNPADKATLLAKIRTILNDIAMNFQSFLNALSLGTNPIVIIVIGLAKIILSAIAGFLGQLPATGAATATLSTAFRMGRETVTYAPKLYKNVGAFKADFNAVCMANHHPEAEIK